MPLNVSEGTLIPRPDTEILVEKALQKLQQIKAKEKRIYQKKTQLLIKQLEAYDIDITEIDMITAAVLYVQNNHLVDDALQAFTANTDSELTPNNGDVI